MKLFTKILMTLIFITSAQSFAEDGQSGNGGTIIQVDENKYDLADLHFKPAPSVGYAFDAKLTEELKLIEQILAELPRSANSSFSHFVRDFFAQQIFSTLVEYKFVAKLPSQGCSFIPVENLPFNLRTKNIGCTQGSITYLLPQFFNNDKLSLTQLALLVVHERLHAAVPTQPYEIKTDIVRAIYVLRSKIQVAIQNKDYSFVLNSEDQSLLNRLTYRFSQLTGEKFDKISFNERGAVFINPKYINPKAKIYVDSKIVDSEITADDIEIKKTRIDDSSLSGKMYRIENSTIYRVDIKANLFKLNNSSLVNHERIGGRNSVLQGDDISISSSSIAMTSIQSSRIDIKNTKGAFKFNSSSDIIIDNTGLDMKANHLEMIFLSSRSVKILKVQNIGADEWVTVTSKNLYIEDLKFRSFTSKDFADKISVPHAVYKLAANSDYLFDKFISGNDIVIQNSIIEYFIDSAAICGSDIHLSNVISSNALVLGSQIQLSDVRLTDALIDNLGKSLQLTNVNFLGNTAFKFYGDVNMSNIGSLKSEKSLTIGQDDTQLSLDGYGKDYLVSKYSILNSIFNINSQKQLNKLAVKQ